MASASVGCWKYALCRQDSRIYIGQTGGHENFRTVGVRGREHVRLGADFLRLNGVDQMKLPRNVYAWMARLGPENFVLTPLQFVSNCSVDI